MADTIQASTDASIPVVVPEPMGASPEETQEFIVNGKPYKLTGAQVKAAVQKGMFADQKLKSIDVLRKNSENLINTLKTPEGIVSLLTNPEFGTSPKEVFKKLMNSDIIDDELKEEMAKMVYEKVVIPSEMSPADRERNEKLVEYEKLKKMDEARKEKEKLGAYQQQLTQIYELVKSEVSSQVLADKEIPKTEATIRSVIEKVRVMNRQGLPVNDWMIKKAIALTKNDILEHQRAIFDSLESAEDLIARFGEERALRMSKALVERIKAKSQVVQKEPDGRKENVAEAVDKKFNKLPNGLRIMEF